TRDYGGTCLVPGEVDCREGGARGPGAERQGVAPVRGDRVAVTLTNGDARGLTACAMSFGCRHRREPAPALPTRPAGVPTHPRRARCPPWHLVEARSGRCANCATCPGSKSQLFRGEEHVSTFYTQAQSGDGCGADCARGCAGWRSGCCHLEHQRRI